MTRSYKFDTMESVQKISRQAELLQDNNYIGLVTVHNTEPRASGNFTTGTASIINTTAWATRLHDAIIQYAMI